MQKEVVQSSGIVVRARPVPPLLVGKVVTTRPDLQSPMPPLVEVKGVAGTEIMAARPGEREYEEWVQKCAELKIIRDALQDNFIWNYGVVDWKHPGTKKFVTEPPKDWKVPELLSKFGLAPKTDDELGQRLIYIQTVILATPEDLESIQDVVLGETTTITEPEVGVITDMFPGDAERGSNSGGTGE